jgi:hypothetical protein
MLVVPDSQRDAVLVPAPFLFLNTDQFCLNYKILRSLIFFHAMYRE